MPFAQNLRLSKKEIVVHETRKEKKEKKKTVSQQKGYAKNNKSTKNTLRTMQRSAIQERRKKQKQFDSKSLHVTR